MKEVVVYQAPPRPVQRKLFGDKTGKRQSFSTWLGKKRSLRQKLLLVSDFLIIGALLGLFLFYAPLLVSEIRYRSRRGAQKITPRIGFGELIKMGLENPVVNSPDPYFSLVIPKIEARAKITANVDAGSRREYTQALKEGVAHAKGTVFPNMKGTIYLFAHSTDAPWNIVRHNAVFYLLRELEPNDQVIVFFQGIRFNYRVVEKKIVEPTETGFFGQREKELLVLQTCYPPGTTRQALLVFAEREPL